MQLGSVKGKTPEAQKEAPKTKAVVAPAAPAYVFPTAKTEPIKTLDRARLYLYGEKKIGKTSLCAQFPEPFFFASEKGYQGLSVYKEDIFDSRGIVSWKKFVQVVDAFIAGGHPFKNAILDTVDRLYESCLTHWCKDNGFDHPSDAGYGKGWSGVRAEFEKQIGKLLSTDYGVVFISHAQEKEVKERTYGTYDKIMPTISGQGNGIISACADAIIYYGYHGNERMMTVSGSESVVSGHRLENNFFVKGGHEKYLQYRNEVKGLKEEEKYTKELETEYKEKMRAIRIHSVSCGIDAGDAYLNLKMAFENRQTDTGEPDRKNVPALSDVLAPMKSGKK